jgi:hypothetical protein
MRPWHYAAIATVLLIPVGPAPLLAQNGDDAPLSAIDWLSQSVQTPITAAAPLEPMSPAEPPVANSAATPDVTVSPLDSGSPDGVGLLPPSVTGLPRTLWSASDEDTLTTLVQAERVESLPAVQELIITLMLAEADAPVGAGAEGRLFLARVDKLLELGALDPAQSLLEAAGPDTPALFRRWFDVALLIGTEDTACQVLRDKPDVSPTYPARIFCLARGGEWESAALILNTGRALGDISDDEDALLSRFLDPTEYEGEPPLPAPTRPSPLVFRMREAIGEGLPTSTLPRAFAQADLRSTTGWKSQIEAAERLARNGAVDDNILKSVYMARTPAASGGVWDRVAAFQQFDAAITARDAAAVARTLPAVWSAMQTARTEVPFARLYAKDLIALALNDAAAALAFRIALVSNDYEAAALSYRPADSDGRFLQALARGDLSEQPAGPGDPKRAAVAAAFGGAAVPASIAAQISDGKLGEALLRAISLFNQGLAGDPGSITEALSVFRSVGLEDQARRAALQYLLLERQT